MMVPLIGTGVKSRSAVVNAQRRLNCFIEPQYDQDKNAIAVFGTPGLTKVLDQGATPFRGGLDVGNLLYLGQGGKFLEVNNAFAVTDRNPASRFTTAAGRMAMATNESVVLAADGANAYTWDTVGLAFAQVASAMFASPATVTYQDGYFLASFLETGTNKKRCQISADGTTWNALDYRAVDTVPGPLLRTLSFGGEVHQFTDQGIEFWAYTDDPVFPFAPIRGATIPIGLAGRWSIGVGDQSMFFLGRGGKVSGEVQAYELQGHQARSISTPDMANLWNAYGTLSDATGRVVSIDEHTFYVVSFPAAGVTWMYDAYASGLLGVPVWSELQSNGGRHLGDLGFSLVDKNYTSDYGAGALYFVDKTVYTDNGAMIAFELDTRHFFKGYDRVTVDELIAEFETGVGNAVPPGDDPQVMLQISRDGGRTWGAEVWIPMGMGKVGEYQKRISARRIGTARDFVFKLRITDPVKRALSGLGIRATPGVN